MENSNTEDETKQRVVTPLLMRVDEGWVDSIRNPSQFADPGLERWLSQSSNPPTPVVFYSQNRNGDPSNFRNRHKFQLWLYRDGNVMNLDGPSSLSIPNIHRAVEVRFLCTGRCVLSMNAIQQAVDRFEYDIEKLDVDAELSHWKKMPWLRCPDPPEALFSDSDDKNTYIWSAPQVQAQYVPIDNDSDAASHITADGDGSRQVWGVYDLHGWTIWSHNNEEEQERGQWVRANPNPNPCRRINEDFPNRPPKYLEITNYVDFSKTNVVESLYKRFQLTRYALSYNPDNWASESQRVSDILIFQDHKSPHPVTSLYTMAQIVPNRPMREEVIYKAELQNGWSVRPNVADWDAFRQKWRACIGKNTAEKSAMKLFWDAQRNTQQDEWADRPVYSWEQEFGLRGDGWIRPTFEVAEDLEFFVTQQGPIYIYGFIGEQTYSTADPNKERVVGNNFQSSFPLGYGNFDPIRLEVTDENGDGWTVLSSGSAQECLDQTTYPWES